MKRQSSFFPVESNWKPPLMAVLPSWANAKRICIDVETCDPQIKKLGAGAYRDGYIIGISFTIEDGPSAYLPIRHEGGGNLDVAEVLAYLKLNAGIFKGILVGANLPYDIAYLWKEGIFFPNVLFYRDIQLADPLINELHFSYSLHNIANRYGLGGKDETLLNLAAKEYGVDPKSGMWKLPAKFVGPYAEMDTKQPLLILRRQEKLIDEKNLWEIYDLESKVLPVICKMRHRGVLIDQNKLHEVEAWALKQETDSLAIVKSITGVTLESESIWNATKLSTVLDAIGINYKKTEKSGLPSIDQALFGSIDHPVLKAISRARKTNKLRTTFARSIWDHICNGRIHCTYNQMARETESGDQKGAKYGRLSCTHPNLQQQPSRDDFSKLWRSIYIPDEGKLWASCDYSQQEPRWTTHFAAFYDLPEGKVAAKAYHDDPNIDNHEFMSKLTGIPRKQAKNLYLGLCYGEGGAKLCHQLGLPTKWMLTFKGKRRFFEEKAAALQSKIDYIKLVAESLKTQGKTDLEIQATEQNMETIIFLNEIAGQDGKNIINTFNTKAPFIKLLADKMANEAKANGFITTIGGRKLNFPAKTGGGYDWAHKALNRLIQGSAADQTKQALVALDEAGYYLQLQVHDEIISSVNTKDEALAMAKVMENVVPSLVPFRVDVEVGPSWGESMG